MSKGSRWLKVRLVSLLVFFLIAFAGLTVRAFQLQIVENGRLKARASDQYRKTIDILPERGEIYDRNLNELAISMEVDSVYAQPSMIEDRRTAAEAVSSIVSVDAGSVYKRLRDKSSFVWLKRQIDMPETERSIVRGIRGVGLLKERKRFYPAPQLASNMIGFVGYDSIGLEGLEWRYNNYLRGEGMKIAGLRDARGKEMVFDDGDVSHASKGSSLILTLDRTIQYIAEKELLKAATNANAKAGIAIVMDPSNGEILAMASYPTFDPNNFRRYRPRDWRNRALTDLYEPGSVFKIFLVAAALEEGVVEPNDIIYCENGGYRVADRIFHDTMKHGWLTVKDIVKYSSNIGAVKLADRLGRSKYYRYINEFGFGKKTGIDLPGEVSGYVRKLQEWSRVTFSTISFGQGISATPIQLITAASAIANKGVLMRPYVVKAVVSPDGEVVKEVHPVIERRVVSEETALEVTEILKRVTKDGGSGERAAISFVDVAGKTGTSQKPDPVNGGYAQGKYISSFLGYAPADSPRLAIIVMIDEPSGDFYGSTVAAPVFREILKQSMAYMGILPNKGGESIKPVKLAAIRRTNDDIEGGRMPDFRGKSMRMVLRMAKRIPLEVKVVGSGKAISQRPSPGGKIGRNRTAEVRFQ